MQCDLARTYARCCDLKCYAPVVLERQNFKCEVLRPKIQLAAYVVCRVNRNPESSDRCEILRMETALQALRACDVGTRTTQRLLYHRPNNLGPLYIVGTVSVYRYNLPRERLCV